MQETKVVSINEVAARAGVSPGTVSHVLNNNVSARIALATQERVRRAAAELDYRPNRFARSLGRRKTDTIGLLISGLRNPFFVEVLENAQRAVLRAGFAVLLDTAPSVQGTYMTHAPVRTVWPVDGALVWSWNQQNAADFLGPQSETMPLVYIGADRADGSDSVSFHYELGGRMAGEYLVSRGHRSIGYVGPYRYAIPEVGIDPGGELRAEEGRHRGCRLVCHAAGVGFRQLVTEGEETRAAGLRMGARIAAMPRTERPDALFCHNDVLAIGVYSGLVRAGVRVPEEIAVVGFDGTEEASILPQSITTVQTDTMELADRAIELLVRRLQGDRETPPQRVILNPRLIQGETA